MTKNDTMNYSMIQVDLQNEEHCQHLLKLLNDYMEDPMGGGEPMPPSLGPRIINGLRRHTAYLGFFVVSGNTYLGLANCNLNFSTFQARPLINIHDLIIAPEFQGQGAGRYLLESVLEYASENGCCRVNLEVRQDNERAQSLYEKLGFGDCLPAMFFWEKNIR